MFTIRLFVHSTNTVIIITIVMTASFSTHASKHHGQFTPCENICHIRRGEADCEGRGLTSALLTGCDDIRRISLAYNDLSQLTADLLPPFPNLQILDMSNNPITHIAPGSFADNPQLLEVILNDIKLPILLNETFDGLSQLERLYCIHGKLEVLEQRSLAGLSSLLEIDLSFNKIRMLPADIFEESVGLEIISLSVNRLTALPTGLFHNLRELRELKLVSNRLTVLQDGLFDGLDAMEKLDLRGNGLTEVPVMNVKYLDLSINNIIGLPFPGDVEGGLRWRVVKLKNNRLLCDHTIEPLRLWYSCQRNESCNGTATVDDWVCYSPEMYNGVMLDHLPSLATTVVPTTTPPITIPASRAQNDEEIMDGFMGNNNRFYDPNNDNIDSSVGTGKGSAFLMLLMASLCRFVI